MLERICRNLRLLTKFCLLAAKTCAHSPQNQKEDLNANLGTIARSGTKAFIEKIAEDKNAGESNLIGQFGVGFYSAFMAAKRINVYTRKAATDKIFKWSSNGTNSYTIEEIKADSDEAKKYGFDKNLSSDTLTTSHSRFTFTTHRINTTTRETSLEARTRLTR